jgi:hypothetical protein
MAAALNKRVLHLIVLCVTAKEKKTRKIQKEHLGKKNCSGKTNGK